MGKRRLARQAALQALYLMDIAFIPREESLETILRGVAKSLDEETLQFTRKLYNGAAEHLDLLDKLISKYTENWDIKNMAGVDRNILRLAGYELVFELETPVSVIINEAVEIAKRYSTDNSGKFVNGILDKIKLERNETTSPNVQTGN